MYNLLMKNGQVMAFGIGVAVVLIFMFMMFGGTPDADNPGLAFGLVASMIFIGLAALAAAGFAVFQNMGNVKGLVPSVLAFIATIFALIKFVGFAMETTAAVVDESELLDNGLTAGQDSIVGIGMTIGLGMLGLAALIWIISLVMDFFKG